MSIELPSTSEDIKFIVSQIEKICSLEDQKAATSTAISTVKKDLQNDYGIQTADCNLIVKLMRKKTTLEAESERLQSVSEALETLMNPSEEDDSDE